MLDRDDLTRVNDRIFDAERTVLPTEVGHWQRSISAREDSETDLGSLVTDDERVLDAASRLGLRAAAPA